MCRPFVSSPSWPQPTNRGKPLPTLIICKNLRRVQCRIIIVSWHSNEWRCGKWDRLCRLTSLQYTSHTVRISDLPKTAICRPKELPMSEQIVEQVQEKYAA